MWFIIALTSLALAGDPTSRAPVRCEVVWTGPAPGCDLAGEWAATGLGSDEDAARLAALTRLKKALDAGSETMATHFQQSAAANGSSPQKAACQDDAASMARFTCFTEEELKDTRLCFADLPDADCWTADPMLMQGTVWREEEKGRDQVCKQMEEDLHANNVPAEQVTTCRARCYQEARVRCPPGLLDDSDQWGGRPYFITEDNLAK